MGSVKKIILAITLLLGIVGITNDFHQFGIKTGMELALVYMFTTAFLWYWAAGYAPTIGKFTVVIISIFSGMATLLIINWALASELRVDLIEVIRETYIQKPLFYALIVGESILKVFFWDWLFSSVREEEIDEGISVQ